MEKVIGVAVWLVVFLAVAAVLGGLAGWVLALVWGVVAVPMGAPPLMWWQAWALLVGVGLLGRAFRRR